jgi:hypothetical protein
MYIVFDLFLNFYLDALIYDKNGKINIIYMCIYFLINFYLNTFI